MDRLTLSKMYICILTGTLLLILNACTGNDFHPTASRTYTKTPSSRTPTSTSAATITSLPKQTEYAPGTPKPTLPAKDVEARAIDLLKTNAGCSLPCWWGVTPGVSRVDDAKLRLGPFLGAVAGQNDLQIIGTDGYAYMKPLPNGLQVGIEVVMKENLISLIFVQTKMTKDIYQQIYDDASYQEIMSAYTLKTILGKYGTPEQILIRSFSDLAGENNPTQLLLYYPQRGIIAQYFSENSLKQQNTIIMNSTCPPKSHISLRLFSPHTTMSLKELLEIDDSYSKYRDLTAATDMTIESFVKNYQVYNEKKLNSSCTVLLNTPWSLWPNEYRNP